MKVETDAVLVVLWRWHRLACRSVCLVPNL